MGARPQGFTLIETLIAMAVLGILMTAGVPMYTQWIQNSQIRTAAESITSGLQVARNEAVRTNQQVRFELPDPASSAWRICVWDVANNACLGAPIQERNATEGGQNAQLGGALVDTGNYTAALGAGAGLPAGVTFNAFGRLANPGFDLRRIDVRNALLSAADERRLIILVSVGGQVRMCDAMHNRATNAQGC